MCGIPTCHLYGQAFPLYTIFLMSSPHYLDLLVCYAQRPEELDERWYFRVVIYPLYPHLCRASMCICMYYPYLPPGTVHVQYLSKYKIKRNSGLWELFPVASSQRYVSRWVRDVVPDCFSHKSLQYSQVKFCRLSGVWFQFTHYTWQRSFRAAQMPSCMSYFVSMH